MSTVGLNEATIAQYIRGQEKADIALDLPSVKEYKDPFDGGRSGNSTGLTDSSRENLQFGSSPREGRRLWACGANPRIIA